MKVQFSYCQCADRSIAPPQKQTIGAAGYDVRANLHAEDREKGLVLESGASLAIPTGLSLASPDDLLCEARSRSGLAKSSSIVVLNSPGTIDPDYRGEISIILINHGASSFVVSHGMRIAQLVFTRFESPDLIEVDQLPNSDRAKNGFGSTGLS